MYLRVKIGVTADEATSNPPAGNHNSTINTRRTINTSSSAEEDGKQNLTESYCAMRKKSRFRESVANKAASERQANGKQAATTLPSIPTKPFNTIIVCRGGRCMIFWNLQIKQKIPEAKASGNLLEVTTRFELVDEGFADPCLTTWPRHHRGSDDYHSNGAADEARTRYLHLGKVALYQMSYGRIFGAFILAPTRTTLYKEQRLSGSPRKLAKQDFVGKRRNFWICLAGLACKTGKQI